VSDEVRALAGRLPDGVRLGTSSWSFPGWRGLVWAGAHGEAALARHGLAAYARHPLLRTVGVDRTHYAPVSADVLRGYAAAVPPGFRFLVKAHEACTLAAWPGHARYGAQRGQPNPLCLDAAYARDAVVAPFVEGLGEAGGPLVFQLAPQPPEAFGGPRRFAERLYRFLRALPQGPLYAVELRTPALLTADYAACLRAAGAAHCVAVHPSMPAPAAQARAAGVDAQPALVVRWLLAPGHDYGSALAAYQPFDRLVDPDPSARAAVAQLVTAASGRGAPAWVIVNNKAEGCAPQSCLELARRLAP
jgi:uncharacterized protein YecE (DUF72 family)